MSPGTSELLDEARRNIHAKRFSDAIGSLRAAKSAGADRDAVTDVARHLLESLGLDEFDLTWLERHVGAAPDNPNWADYRRT